MTPPIRYMTDEEEMAYIVAISSEKEGGGVVFNRADALAANPRLNPPVEKNEINLKNSRNGQRTHRT